MTRPTRRPRPAGPRPRPAGGSAARAARLAAALDALPQGVLLLDRRFRVAHANRGLLELLGQGRRAPHPAPTLEAFLAAGEAAGRLPPGTAAPLAAAWRAHLAHGAETSAPLALADGRSLGVTVRRTGNRGWALRLEAGAGDAGGPPEARDALTGLPDRRVFHDRLAAALERAGRDGSAVAVLCLDLDHFKAVNDTLGHPVGDALLRAVAERLRAAACARPTLVARLGGDEFAIVQAGIEQPQGATALAAAPDRAIVGRPTMIDGHQVVIGTSVGIALAPDDGADPDQLLKNADLALYRAKADGPRHLPLLRAGDGRPHAGAPRARARPAQARSPRGEFELHYQPLVDLADRAGSAASRRCCAGATRSAAWCRRPSSSRSPRRSA